MKVFLLELARRARKHSLDCLLMGGHAVGLLARPRATRDVDLLVPDGQKSGWKVILEDLGYRAFHDSPPFLQFNAEGPVPLPPVDLMGVDEGTFSAMKSQARVFPELLPGFDVISPEHLIALKLHALRFREAGLREQDWADILSVANANGLSPDDDSISQLLRRHGPPDAGDEWRRRLR